MAATVKVPADPTVKVEAFAEVISGAACTVNVKLCVAFGLIPLVAVIVTGNEPVWAGVPESTPVVLLSVTPEGRFPISLKVGAGVPEAITAKLPELPLVNVVAFAEVICGAGSPAMTGALEVEAEPPPLALVATTVKV